jgi:hypothetical protein
MIELLDGVYCGRKCCELHTMISVMCLYSSGLRTLGLWSPGVLAHPITSGARIEGRIPTYYT